MTTNQVLLGVGLILVLAVGSQVLASRARICTRPADGGGLADGNLLFLVRADGRLAPVTPNGAPEPQPGDAMVLLGPARDGS